MTYTWSDNGNLLSDGVSTYTYSHANRLATAVEGGTTYAFTYNGLGDRLRQTVNGSPTSYTLDLAAGLTEVLSDGANAYLYGNGRIGEEQSAGWVYHLGDALGSVRQLASPSGAIVMDRSYEPFGEVLSSTGTRTSNFQFSGQQIDGTGLAYLRARYYSGTFGRFLTRDVWEGDPNQPMSHNGWLYASANPANLTDSSGMYWTDPQCEAVLNLQAREICRADRVRDWQSRTQEPPYTNWSPAYLDISVAPGITTTGPGAQFHVPGYLVSEVPGITECDILETPDLELCQRNTQYCGQISIAAMLALNAQTVVSVWHKYAVRAALGWEEWEGATGHQLAGFVNESYGDRFRATSFTEYGSLSLRWVWDTLHRHTFIMPLVSIVSGNSDPVSGGRVGPGIVLHWVVITGVSSEARLNAEEHFTNWLRIYNPFTNMREYYRWSVFEDAWTRDPYGPDFVIFDPSKRPFPG